MSPIPPPTTVTIQVSQLRGRIVILPDGREYEIDSRDEQEEYCGDCGGWNPELCHVCYTRAQVRAMSAAAKRPTG